MEQTRYEAGTEQLKQVDGIGGENVIRSLEDVAPDLGRYIIEFAFGDIYLSLIHISEPTRPST